MLTYEYKLDGTSQQYAAIDEAIKITQFIRNTCLRRWMDSRGVTANDLQCYYAVLADAYSFASLLNSQARQVAADRAWSAISRFYDNCREKKPGKKGYPQFQHDNRSVEYKNTGWKIDPDGKHITFTDTCGIGRLRLVGNKKQKVERTHHCLQCGLIMDRDENAARNRQAAPCATPLDRRPLLPLSNESAASPLEEGGTPAFDAGECQER